MTPKERAAMQQALKAMKDASPYGLTFKEAIIACEESLAEQAEQEPVAWMRPNGEVFKELEIARLGLEIGIKPIPLYIAPVRTKDLSDDEILDVALSIEIEFSKDTDKFVQQLEDIEVFARAVIAKFKEKNK